MAMKQTVNHILVAWAFVFAGFFVMSGMNLEIPEWEKGYREGCGIVMLLTSGMILIASIVQKVIDDSKKLTKQNELFRNELSILRRRHDMLATEAESMRGKLVNAKIRSETVEDLKKVVRELNFFDNTPNWIGVDYGKPVAAKPEENV